MSERNKNNRIIFLTTLSVYLGLALVGGVHTPSVLAQAARNFDVQDEIEVKDDSGKKPEKDFPFLFVQLLNEIKRQVESGKISSPIPTDFIVDGNYNSCGGGVGSDISDEDLNAFISDALNRKFLPKLHELAENGKISLKADDANLSLKISFAKSNAELFVQFLNQEFYLRALSSENTLTKQVYENTKATSENDQVFIVTRLPRGSLNELVKQSAKAENE